MLLMRGEEAVAVESANLAGAVTVLSAMTRLYLAISVFVATSVAIGVVAITTQSYAWIPIVLGLAGAGLMFQASVLLIIESRIQLRAVRNEMKFTWEAGRQLAPSDLIASHERRRWIRRWFQ